MPKCLACLWYNDAAPGLTCKAYPQGIPDEILTTEVDHDAVRPDQEGEYVYEGPDKELTKK
jgi:hypothetical protein